jgi:hypothetical protein
MVVLYIISTMQRDASANTPPQGSRGLAVVLAYVDECASLVEVVVLVACVSCQLGLATCAHMHVPLPTSCRYETVPNILRNVHVRHFAGKTVHERTSRRIRATGEEGAKPTRLSLLVSTPPFRRGQG